MTLAAQYFLVPKAGSLPEHNDDAAAYDATRARFAISDGAAGSGFAGMWARLMVEQFVHADGAADAWNDWLPVAQRRWLEELAAVDIPWYGEAQFQRGAFATFLGLVFGRASLLDWTAIAVGDSCLFHTRLGNLRQAFPLQESKHFTRTPSLVGSRSTVDETAQSRARSTSGTAQAQDRLWLMSDALSEWCLGEEESGRPPWDELADIAALNDGQATFVAWIQNLRETRGLKSDDVTLMSIEL